MHPGRHRGGWSRYCCRARAVPYPIVDGGLAVAAIASTALSLFQTLDATIMILVWNLGGAALLVALEGAAGGRLQRLFGRTPLL